jgi:RAD51-like protein 2
VDVSIPVSLGGVCGECVYVDTEGSFMASRARDIAEGLHRHIERLQRKKAQTEGEGAVRGPTVEEMMRGIHVFRVFDHVEQLAVLRSLPSFLASHPRVRLVVVDSIAFHFRRGFSADFSTRARLLAAMAQQLIRTAADHHLAVVAINQVTTRITSAADSFAASDVGEAASSLAPALGESWSHSCTSRVLLYWKGGERWARVVKSPSRKQAACRYSITELGIRDVRTTTQQPHTAALNTAPPHVPLSPAAVPTSTTTPLPQNVGHTAAASVSQKRTIASALPSQDEAMKRSRAM